MNIQGRSLLTLRDFSPQEIDGLISLAIDLKTKKQQGTQGHSLEGKNIVLIFEKTSTRTRCAFEVAVHDEGGHVTFLTNSQMGYKESTEDTARVLGRYYDGIEFRGYSQDTVEQLARHAGVPVWNGLTDMYHPTQVLADFMTLQEHLQKDWADMNLCYMGDGRGNVAHSLLAGAAKLGMGLNIVSPDALFPDSKVRQYAEGLAEQSGARISVTSSVQAVEGSDAIYTDVWASLGEEDKFDERISLLRDYQVNSSIMQMTGNADCLFMHCLPAFHNRDTELGRTIYQKYGLEAMEVTDDVFRSNRSVVFDQAENRLHTAKAVMVATLT